jgi:hypothetical protein
MRFFKIFFTIWVLIGLYNLIDTIIQYEIRPEVYGCSEVTNSDPIKVQKICNRVWKRK